MTTEVNDPTQIVKSNPTPSAPLPRLAYSLRDSAEIIGVSYQTAYRLNKRGLLKSCTALRHKMIPLSEIERFLKSNLE